MPFIHLFNPENDFALALGKRSYTPDKGARAIRRAGCMLPLWWANDRDSVLVDDALCAEEAIAMREKYGLKADIVTAAPADHLPLPWGWSHYTRRQFLNAGVSEHLLPSDAYLDAIRNLSHRRTSITINRALGIPASSLPVEATTVAEALDAVGRFGEDAVVKLPWSSSGRGVIYSSASPRSTFEGYIAGMLRRQGSVTVERRHDRLVDFAMLFHSDGQTVAYRGLSTFATDGHGFYSGNIVARQEYIARLIGVDTHYIIEPLTAALEAVVLPVEYQGWIGVDMMIYKTPTGSRDIAPCVEVNFRQTMGTAALQIATRLRPTRPMVLTANGLNHI